MGVLVVAGRTLDLRRHCRCGTRWTHRKGGRWCEHCDRPKTCVGGGHTGRCRLCMALHDLDPDTGRPID